MRSSNDLASTLHASGDNLLKSARERLDPDWVDDADHRAELHRGRWRELPPPSIVWTVIGACLLAGQTSHDVVRHPGLMIPTAQSNQQAVPASSAVLDAWPRP